MKKKTDRKSRSVKSLRTLPGASVKGKTAQGVKGGSKTKGDGFPTENISLSYASTQIKYTPQN